MNKLMVGTFEDTVLRLKEHFIVYTDKDLLEELGISRHTFAVWRRKKAWSGKSAAKICREYGFNLDWFYKGKGEKFMSKRVS